MRRLADRPTWVLLGGLVALSTVLRAVAGLEISTPLIGPDEQTYAELGRSIYEHGRFEIWDQTNRFYTLTYPLLVGLALSNGDVEIGYAALKVIQALVMSLTAVPVYLWGRTFMSRGWALVAAALTLSVPGLAYSGLVMTEVLFLPIATVTAWVCARALERPTIGRQALAAALILVACATRLQAVVFVPVIATAIVLKALLDRRPRDLLRFWPAASALGAAVAAWAVYRLGNGAPASELLAAYRSAGDVSYSLRDILRFVAWHFADVILFTGVACTVAVALLLARWRELGQATSAFVVFTAAAVFWFVLQVGTFASRNVEHIAERDLLALVPLLFLALCAWIYHRAPRPRRTAIAVAAIVIATVVYLPVQRFLTDVELADGFTIVPFIQLREHTSALFVDLVVTAAAVLALAATLLLPRQLLRAVPVVLVVVFAALSVSTSRELAVNARFLRDATTGPDRTWVSEAADGPVTFVWTSDLYSVAPWSLRFWNANVRSAVRLDDVYLPGPIPAPLAGTGGDGRLVVDGVPVEASHVVLSSSVVPVGEALSKSGPMTLWNVEQPFRLARREYGIGYDGTVNGEARTTVYGCTGGSLSFTLLSNADQTIELLQNGILVDSRALKAEERWEGAVAALPREGGTCELALRAPGTFHAERFELQQ